MSLIHDVIKMNMVRRGYLPNYPYHLISDTEMFDAFLSKHVDANSSEVHWSGSFMEVYPCLSDNLYNEYEELREAMMYHIEQHLVYPKKYKGKVTYRYELPKSSELNEMFGENNVDGVLYSIVHENIRVRYDANTCSWKDTYDDGNVPDWVYSYMLGSTIGPLSDVQDIQDLATLLNLDTTNSSFDFSLSSCCLDISKKWVSKLSDGKDNHRPPTMFGEPHVIKQLRILQSNISAR